MTTTTSAGPPAAQPDRCPYRGASIAVGTRHGKQRQFGPAFHDVLGARLVTPADLDTDAFGTFTPERPRRHSALQAARAKAHLAMTATGLPLALASEASYGPLPGLGVPGHEELLVFCDRDLGIEVTVGHRSAGIPAAAHIVVTGDALPDAVLSVLPRQALIVRPVGLQTGVLKGITTAAALRSAVDAAAACSPEGAAVVEPDLRAHRNPSRRAVLVTLARTLASRLATACPQCDAPGFGRVDSRPGRPCRHCGTPTALAAVHIHACCRCTHRADYAVDYPGADPAHCPSCNP